MDLIADGEIVKYAAYLLAGGATFIVALMLFKEEEARAAAENLDELGKRDASNPIVKITRPFFTQYVVPMIRGKKNWDNYRRHYKRRIVSGGLKEEFTADEFISFKLFMIFFFPLVGGFLNALEVLDLSGFVIVGLGGFGWFYPDLWINSRIKKRQLDIKKSMPFIVDLLALSTEAGLDFLGAIGRVVEKANPSPLVDELEQLLKEIKVGSSRAEALREMAVRIDMIEIRSFVAILISADQMGSSIGKTLRQQSDQIRTDRFTRAEKAGAKAASALIIPIVLIVFPAVLLMIAGPFILGFIYPSGV